MIDEESFTISARIPEELNRWVEEIQKEFEKKRGFTPSKSDVLKNIVRQFKGNFVV